MVPNCATAEDLLKTIKDEKVQMIDLRFTDLPGVWQHFSVPPGAVNANALDEGIGFDGSSIRGFQEIQESDMLVVPDPSKSISQNAIEPWSKPHYRTQLTELKRAARGRVRLDVPWVDLSDDEKRFVIDGDGASFEGVKGFFRWLERKKYKVHVRVFLSRYRGYLTCPECNGARLRRRKKAALRPPDFLDFRLGDYS